MSIKPARVPAIFHEDISLSRQSIAKINKTIFDNPGLYKMRQSERRKIFEETTLLGSNYVKAMPYYARGCGLIGQKYDLSLFGQAVLMRDEKIDLLDTQWLMHYYISAPQGPGPIFWNQVISKFFYPSNIFSKDEIAEFIGNFVWQTENRVISARKIQSTANILLNAYIKPEGLGKLRILEPTDSGRFRVQTSTVPTAWAIAYALLDFWDAHYPGRISVSLDTLKDSNFIKLFLMAKSDLDEVLQSMQEIRYVEVHRAAPPYQVVLLRQDREPILDKLYGSS